MAHADLECVIFDLDGLLIDSESLQFEAYQVAFRYFDVELTLADWVEWHTVEASARRWIERHQLDIDATELRDRKRVVYERLVDEQLSLKPGADYLVRHLADADVRLCVASGSRASSIRYTLQKFGLEEFFERFCSAQNETRSKPYPDVYLTAMREMSVTAEQVVAIEDSPTGLAAATAAGIRCVVCPDSFMPHHRPFSDESLMVNNLHELNVDTLGTLLRN